MRRESVMRGRAALREWQLRLRRDELSHGLPFRPDLHLCPVAVAMRGGRGGLRAMQRHNGEQLHGRYLPLRDLPQLRYQPGLRCRLVHLNRSVP
jgi:hypothetical protein